MNKLNIAMAALCSAGMLASCSKNQGSQQTTFQAPSVEIQDGRVSPEVLAAFARVGGPQVSPDGKTVIFTVAYESIESNSSNSA